MSYSGNLRIIVPILYTSSSRYYLLPSLNYSGTLYLLDSERIFIIDFVVQEITFIVHTYDIHFC